MEHRMVRLLFRTVISLGLVALALPAFGAEFRLQSETLLRGFERGDDFVAPAYEYLQADIGDPWSDGVSFHLYGWGRADLASSEFFRDDTAGELLYGYLEYTRSQNDFRIKFGRQYIFEGVSNLSLDGIRLSGELTPWFSASAYAGWAVALDSEQGRDGDFASGGRLAHHLGTLYEVGLSYRQVNNDDDLEDERVGIDISAALPAGVSLFGFSNYNIESEGWAEHSYEARFDIADFYLRPYFEHFQFEDYFNEGDFSANPFRFLARTGETLTTYGGDLQWVKLEDWELGLQFKYHDYDDRDDSSQFYSGLATWHGDDLTQAGGELGYMDGNTADTRYLLARAFFYIDDLPKEFPLAFLSGDAVLTFYDEDINGEDAAVFLSLGAGRKFLDDALEIRLSGDYSSDPYFDHDFRGLLIANYAFDI